MVSGILRFSDRKKPARKIVGKQPKPSAAVAARQLLEDRVSSLVDRIKDESKDLGHALAEIHDKKLYKQISPRWAEYLDRMKWGISATHSYRLMFAADLANRLKFIGFSSFLQTEQVARLIPRSVIDNEAALESLWLAAVAGAKESGSKKVTADIIKSVIKAQAADEPEPESGRTVDDLLAGIQSGRKNNKGRANSKPGRRAGIGSGNSPPADPTKDASKDKPKGLIRISVVIAGQNKQLSDEIKSTVAQICPSARAPRPYGTSTEEIGADVLPELAAELWASLSVFVAKLPPHQPGSEGFHLHCNVEAI